jgi:hypothetical protein
MPPTSPHRRMRETYYGQHQPVKKPRQDSTRESDMRTAATPSVESPASSEGGYGESGNVTGDEYDSLIANILYNLNESEPSEPTPLTRDPLEGHGPTQ